MSFLKSIAPALTLIVLAPLITEVLPGATRFSSIFVFPIEVCVWGGGALMIRAAVHKWNLSWLSMLLLAMALAIAEECLIQQTSLAPLVIRLKGVTYARSFGVNYVYMLWALIYEPVFVVFLPIYLCELIFVDRNGETWLNKTGTVITVLFFLIGAFFAWFSWTRIARTKVFHLLAYHPPVTAIAMAVFAIILLVILAFKYIKVKEDLRYSTIKPPNMAVLYFAGVFWAIILYGIVVLAFGLAPYVSPIVPIAAGLILIITAITWIPRWTASPQWTQRNTFALVFAVMLGSMAAGYVGFIGASPADLYFKIITNIIALVLLFRFAFIIEQRRVDTDSFLIDDSTGDRM